jgi:sulfite exporter TauE/SafE
MLSTLITHIQIFGIGLSFGLAGPCLVFCTPLLVTYVMGRKERMAVTLADISAFLAGRLIAYLVLGALAGFSGSLLRRLIEPAAASGSVDPLTGAVSIILGIIILFNRRPASCACPQGPARFYGFGGLLALGFMMGISPCAPLAGLLLQIALMSKGVADGTLYALSFGLGTMLSGFIIVGAISITAKGVADRLLGSEKASGIFRTVCAALLITFGLFMMFRSIIFGR